MVNKSNNNKNKSIIKENGLWFAIKYYSIIYILLFATVLFISKSVILNNLFKDKIEANLISKNNQITTEATTTELYDYDIIKLLNDSNAHTRLDYSVLYKLVNALSNIIIIATIIAIIMAVFNYKYYYHMTGRSIIKDKAKYNLSYSKLLEFHQNSEPNKMDISQYPNKPWQKEKGIIIGTSDKKLISISSDSEGNIAVFGSPGSGKTSGIAIPSAVCFEGSVLAVDIKGDIYNAVSKSTKRKIYRFCPDNPNALTESCRFDPLLGIENMTITEQKAFFENMSIVLIKYDGCDKDNYFVSRARKAFVGIVFLLLHQNPDISFPEIIHSILKGNIFDFVKEAIKSDCIIAKEYLASFYGNNPNNVSGVYDTITSALVTFSNPVLDVLLSREKSNTTQGLTPSISIEALEKGYDIYLQISQEHLTSYAPLFTLIMQNISTAFTRRPDTSTGAKNRPILMLLDEFPQLTFSQTLINTNLSTLRSKSVIIMLIQQNLSQLDIKYSSEGTNSILGNCNCQIILDSNDTKSSAKFSEKFGEKEVIEMSNSYSYSKGNKTSSSNSVHFKKVRVFPPEYFGSLPSKSALIMYYKGKYIELKKINCYKD